MNRIPIARIATAAALIAIGSGIALLLGATWQGALAGAVAALVALALVIEPGEESVVESGPAPSDDILDNPALDRLLEGLSDPVLIAARGKVVRANRAALRLLGTHIVGADARIAIRHPAAAERLASPAPLAEAVTIELAGLGTRNQRWEMRIAPLVGDRRIVQLIDRTGSHAAEKMRVDFVANASHELRTPLAAILGFVETLADPKAGGDEETRNRFLAIMDGEARRMQQLVDDLMSLSRIEAEKYRAPDGAVDLKELVGEVTDVFRRSHGARGQDIETEIEGPVPIVQGDRAQLSQLLHNLIGNSAKYGRAGTPITIRLANGPSGMVKLAVDDEGEGIAPDHLPRLTERFYRVDSGRSRAMGGTGLGLAIVKHIVERHRGRLDIASIVGKGTTITVLLPVAEA